MKIQPKNEYAIGSWVKKIIESCKTKEQLDSAWRLKELFYDMYYSKWELSVELNNCYEEKKRKIYISEK
tara:strand:- start:174 stop:380 length:207 start_codon:yes stop_codon:yes gene_type:complete